MTKEDVRYIHTQWDINQPLKSGEILPFVTTWMDLEGIMFSEINQTEKDKYYMITFIYGILKKGQAHKAE